MPQISMRPTCGMCHDVSVIDFLVPGDVWIEVVHPRYQGSVLCLRCFARRADEKLIDWSQGIQLFPRPLSGHLVAIGAIEKATEVTP